jgi:hypothetical protein
MSCKKNTYCLNKKDGKKILLDYVTNTFKGKTSTSFKNYSFYIDSKKMSYQFKIHCSYKKQEFEKTKKSAKKKLLLEIFDNKKKYCLKFEFMGNKQHPDFKNFRGFKKSYIHNINKNVCGIKKTKHLLSLSGSYILHLTDKINKIFKVEVSSLSDDSRIEAIAPSVHLKIIKLYEYNKTWYQKEGGFLPENHIELSQNSKDAGKLKLKDLYKYYMDDKLRHWGINEQFVKEEDMNEVYKILKKEKLDENSNLKSISIAFKSKVIKNSEKLSLWNNIFSLTKREKISKSKNPEYKLIQGYLFLLDSHHQITHTKTY